MGRELHDSTSQTLVALQLKVMYLKEMIEDPHYRAFVTDVEHTIHELHEEIRAVSLMSSFPPMQEGMLPAALRVMAARFGKLTKLEIRFRACGTYRLTSATVEASVYRIAQEALANIYRHAKAGIVNVRLESSADSLRLLVEDDGVGISKVGASVRTGGVGLPNMRQRVRELGGKLQVRQLKHGSRIIATIPNVMERNDHASLPAMAQESTAGIHTR